MPIYEYKCRKCGGEFKVFHKMTDADVKSCKFCRGPVSKLVSLSSFKLQGSGWYVTDYGGKKPEVTEHKTEHKKEESTPEVKKTAAEAAPAATEKS